MIVFKCSLVMSVIGLAAFPFVANLIEAGKEVSALSAVGLLGVVAVASVSGMVFIYKSKEKEQRANMEKREELIAKSVEAMQKSADAIHANTGVMVEVKNAVRGCNHNAAT